ncbi:HAD family hydrolase [Streptococcus hongkongensis]|nr:HAD family hydrolase [Streptococcus uberis]
MVKAIIFDMDGVLFDTEPFYLNRRQQFFDEHAISINHLSASDFIGGNLQHIWKDLLSKHYQSEQAKAVSDAYDAYKKRHLVPYCDLLFPNVKQTLAKLKEDAISLVLASNSSRTDIEQALESCHLKEYFTFVLCAEDVSHPKPAPDIYLKAKQLLELEKQDIWVIEDSQKGILAAKNAGYKVFAIKDTRYGIDQSQADQLIDAVEQIIDYLI